MTVVGRQLPNRNSALAWFPVTGNVCSVREIGHTPAIPRDGLCFMDDTYPAPEQLRLAQVECETCHCRNARYAGVIALTSIRPSQIAC